MTGHKVITGLSYPNRDEKQFERLCQLTAISMKMMDSEFRLHRLEALAGIKANFNPSQPRVPAGSADGGQWTSGGGLHRLTPEEREEIIRQNAIEPFYPVETILGFLTGAQALNAIRLMAASARIGSLAASAETESNIISAAKAIEKFLGGKGKVITNPKNGNKVIMRSDKKIRFDIEDPGNDAPHFHIQKQNANGRWKNILAHRHYFKDSSK